MKNMKKLSTLIFVFILLISRPGFSQSDTCFWPGDINRDGFVNYSDHLYLAVTKNDSGATRGNSNADCFPYPFYTPCDE